MMVLKYTLYRKDIKMISHTVFPMFVQCLNILFYETQGST